MNKLITLVSLSILIQLSVTFQAITNESGPPDGHTNAPGNANCTACHSGTPLQTSGTVWSGISLTSTVSFSSFLPNSSYTMSLTFSDPGSDKYGFQVLALPTGANASSASVGTFSVSNTHVQTQSSSGRNYVNHTSSGTLATGNTKTWTFTWNTPVSFSGGVVFYVVVNSTDASNSSSGDVIYAKTFSATVLPVNWLSQSAKRIDQDRVQLDWATASELNNREFELERSEDGTKWDLIHTVQGSGNTTSKRYYTYVDNQAKEDQLYYRIRQIDYDGKYDYSNIMSVSDVASYNLPKLSWNGSYLSLYAMLPENKYGVTIYNMKGEKVKQLLLDKTQTQVDLTELKNGIYVIALTDGSTQHYTKIYKP